MCFRHLCLQMLLRMLCLGPLTPLQSLISCLATMALEYFTSDISPVFSSCLGLLLIFGDPLCCHIKNLRIFYNCGVQSVIGKLSLEGVGLNLHTIFGKIIIFTIVCPSVSLRGLFLSLFFYSGSLKFLR